MGWYTIKRYQVVLLLCGLLFPCTVVSGPNLSWEEAQLRSKQVSAVDYQLYFRFTGGNAEYRAETTVAFTLESIPAKLFLDFQGDKLEKLVVNGHPVKRASIENYRVYLAPEFLKIGRNHVAIRYTNQFDTDGTGLHRFVDPIDGREYFFSHFEPFKANRLFPCFDQPDLKASFSVTVEAPTGWKIISNTLAQIESDGKQARHVFPRSKRFSTYLFTLAGGPFVVFEDRQARIPSRVFSTYSMSGYVDAGNIFEVTRQGFDFYEKYFAIPYPFGKYDQIFVPHFNAGAMENVAAVIIKEDAYLYRETPLRSKLQKRANTILHEMAHMWFGDIVTMRWWNDLWLNESFATYMSYLAQVEGTPDKDAWQRFSGSMKNWAYWQDQLPTTHPIETRVEDTLSTFDNFDGITYGKGASVIKQLAFYAGEDAFRKGVSEYLKKHQWKNAERKDFTEAIGRSAAVSLAGWTRLWLQKSGINTLRAEYDVDPEGRISRFDLVQEKGNGDRVLRPHRLQIALFYGSSETPRIGKLVTAEISGQRAAVAGLVGQPAPDFVFTNFGDHAYAKFYLDDHSLEYARLHLELLPAPARTSVWSTLWFMVRDGKLSPSTYMDVFLDKAILETDASLVRAFRWNLNTLLTRYLGEGAWRESMHRLYATAWKQVNLQQPGSDLQAVWFDYLLRSAISADADARLERILQGKTVIPGLELSQDRRWQIIVRLAIMGHRGIEKLLKGEEGRDVGERGLKYGFAARAAMPDATMKEEVWQKLLTDQTLPLTHVRAALDVYFQRSQLALTRPYVKRYFQVLPSVLQGRSALFARRFIESAYPGIHVEPAVLKETGNAMATARDAPHFFQRLLVEARDDMQRALCIRQIEEQAKCSR